MSDDVGFAKRPPVIKKKDKKRIRKENLRINATKQNQDTPKKSKLFLEVSIKGTEKRIKDIAKEVTSLWKKGINFCKFINSIQTSKTLYIPAVTAKISELCNSKIVRVVY